MYHIPPTDCAYETDTFFFISQQCEILLEIELSRVSDCFAPPLGTARVRGAPATRGFRRDPRARVGLVKT